MFRVARGSRYRTFGLPPSVARPTLAVTLTDRPAEFSRYARGLLMQSGPYFGYSRHRYFWRPESPLGGL